MLKNRLKLLLNKTERLLATDVRYLIREGFWLSSGQGVSAVVALLMAIAFANLISPTTYGNYKYLLSFAGMLSILTLPGLNTAVTQAVARGLHGSFWEAFKYRLKGGIILAITSLSLSGYYLVMENYWLMTGFILIAIFTPIMESANIFSSLLNGKKIFRLSTSYNLIIQIITSILVFITINLTDQVGFILFSYLGSYSVLNIFFLLKTAREQIDNSAADPQTLKFGLRLSGISLLTSISNYLDSIILWHFLGPIQLATYTFAQAAITPAKGLLKSLLNLAMPKFANRPVAEIRKTLPGKMFKAFGLFVVPVVIFIFIIPIVFQLIFPQYVSSIPYAQVMALSLILFPEKLLGIMFTAKIKERQLYTLNIVNPVIKIALLLILIPIYGIWGAVAAMIIQQLVAIGLSLFLFYRLPTEPVAQLNDRLNK